MDRLLLTVALLVIIGLAAYGLLVGWRHRARRQAGVASPPATPAVLGAELARPLAALYVSTTPAGRWQERIVVHTLGRRASATVHLHPEGVRIERRGESDIFVPMGDLEAIATAAGIAGKVMGMVEGVLVLTWRLGDNSVDTGLRARDLDVQQDWIEAARAAARLPDDRMRNGDHG